MESGRLGGNFGLIIRCSKFRKGRLVPLHTTAQVGLERYLQKRRPFAPFDDHVFVSLRRRPLLVGDAETAFRTAAQEIGLKREPGLPRPTIHSLQHTFAVRSLEICPDGRDRVTKHMLGLSTYLGHSGVQTTEGYTRADPSVKWEALESVIAPKLRTGRFKATDQLIAILKATPVMRSEKPSTCSTGCSIMDTCSSAARAVGAPRPPPSRDEEIS